MTRQKHLKTLIRTRMEKTGERYAAARRHVVGGSTAAVAADNEVGWHFAGNIPAATALRTVLAAAGMRDPQTGAPLSEAMIAGLAGGIGIGVFAFLYEKEDFASLFIGGRHLWQDDNAYIQNALRRVGAEIEVHEGSAKATGAALKGIVGGGRPAIAFVEAGLLPHRRTSPDMFGGGYHVVTVHRFDEQDVLIGDLSEEPVRVDVRLFEEARSRIKKHRNRIIAVTDAPRSIDLSQAAAEALRACHEGLHGAGAIGGSRRNFSLDALSDLEARLTGAGKQSWAMIFTPGRRLWNALTMLFEFVELHGGEGLGRSAFAEFLSEIAPAVPAMADIGTGYGALGRKWSDFAHAALPDGVPVFREAKAFLTERSELRLEPIAVDTIKAIERVNTGLQEASTAVADCFPLDEKQYAALRAELRDRLHEIRNEEVRLDERLRQLSVAPSSA